MLAPQDVQRMLSLSALSWRAKRVSRELGCSRNTEWLAERLRRHTGNADVVRQDLAR